MDDRENNNKIGKFDRNDFTVDVVMDVELSRLSHETNFDDHLSSTSSSSSRQTSTMANHLPTQFPQPRSVSSTTVNYVVKPFACNLCEKTFTTKPHLTEHNKAIHMQMYKCNLCEKTFASKNYLTEHNKGIHMKMQYKCKKCGTSCNWLNEASTHCESHPCKVCGISCKGIGLANAHCSIKCTWNNCSFVTRSNSKTLFIRQFENFKSNLTTFRLSQKTHIPNIRDTQIFASSLVTLTIL